jgi:hypothetical protein
LGIASIFFLLTVEIIPVQIRDVLSATFAALNEAGIFVIVSTLAVLFETIRPYGTFWLYATCAFLLVLFMFLFVPETKGKTLCQIEQGMSQARSSSGDDP